MKTIKIITKITSCKDLNKVISNMLKSKIRKDVDKIIDGGKVRFITGGIKKAIKEMPADLMADLLRFYKDKFDAVLISMQTGEPFNESVLNKKDTEILKRLNEYLESRFE